MIDSLPTYVPIVFILTTVVSVGFLLTAIRRADLDSIPPQIAVFFVPFWIFFTTVLSFYGFYLETNSVPPRLMIFGAFPPIIASIFALLFFRRSLISHLPLKTLTLLHVVRIPVEIVLFWLYQYRLVPQAMTFEGHNFDILSGITAPIVLWLAFRGGRVNRTLLLVWNIIAFALLIVIVVTAILAFPSPMQRIAFDQPNIAVTYFPFVWLPSVVVPIVFFAHIASIWQLVSGRIRT